MRLCLLNSLGSPDIWKNVAFYSEPLFLLSERDYNNFKQSSAEFTISRAVFITAPITLNSNIVEISYEASVAEAATRQFWIFQF